MILAFSNRPFPSFLVPLFQNESKCKTFLVKRYLICMKMNLWTELSIKDVVSTRAKSNSEMAYYRWLVAGLHDKIISQGVGDHRVYVGIRHPFRWRRVDGNI